MKIGVVSGDGLAVSGLLTTLRSVVTLGVADGILDLPVAIEFGFSWRPDKSAYYPAGPDMLTCPAWLAVDLAVPFDDATEAALEFSATREGVLRWEELGRPEQGALGRRIEACAANYESRFDEFFERHFLDWVIAINMTLSDSVAVTLGLHRSAAKRWGGGRGGGILYWDHDLFGSYAVRYGGERIYPPAPNSATPTPQDETHVRWAVVSEPLLAEAQTYPGAAEAKMVPNPLPEIEDVAIEARHRSFLASYGLEERPLVLCPVRIFRVKGVEIALELHRAMVDAFVQASLTPPVLLIFGALDEDPEYTADVLARCKSLGLGADTRFLDGVPLGSVQGRNGVWRLDEIDLFMLAAHTSGGVYFTPNTEDVESVGLGPALAAEFGMPVVVTPYRAFREVYGASFYCIMLESSTADAARAFLDLWQSLKNGDVDGRRKLEHNKRIVRTKFSGDPWRELLRAMAASVDRVGRF